MVEQYDDSDIKIHGDPIVRSLQSGSAVTGGGYIVEFLQAEEQVLEEARQRLKGHIERKFLGIKVEFR